MSRCFEWEREDPVPRLWLVSLSCRSCGSGSAWEPWWVAAEGEHPEGEHREGDEGLGAVEPERDLG